MYDGGYDGYNGGPVDGGSILAIYFAAILIVVVLGILVGWGRKKPQPVQPVQMWPAIAAPVPHTPAESAAIASANASGVPFDFLQPHPLTGQPMIFRATPHGNGYGTISLAPQAPGVPYLGYSGVPIPFRGY